MRDNIILELDDRRAWDVFAEAAGPLADDLARALSFVFIGVPLTPGSERSSAATFYVRNITGASAEHGVIAVAHRPSWATGSVSSCVTASARGRN